MRFLIKIIRIASFGIIGGVMLWVGISKFNDAGDDAPAVYEHANQINVNGPKWIQLKQVHLDVMESAYSYTMGKPKEEFEEIFIPIGSLETNPGKAFVLHTADTTLVNPYRQMMQLNDKIRSGERVLAMVEKDPEYGKFMKTSREELEQKIATAEEDLDRFINENQARLSVTIDIEGILNPSFDLSDSEISDLQMLFHSSDIHVIKHNASPNAGFYAWFLVIVGGILVLLVLLNIIGLFIGTKG